MIINTESYHRPKWWRAMKPLPILPILAMLAATGLALSWSVQLVMLGALGIYNAFLSWVQTLTPREITIYHQFPWQYIWIISVYIWLLSPLLLDGLLKTYYGLEPLKFEDLGERYPESLTLWQKFSTKHRIIRPKFKVLSTDLPIALSYGSTPRTGTLVVSTGLLQLLTDEELATVIAAELGKIVNISCFCFSGAVALLQLPYFLYWRLSRWGDKQKFPYPLAIIAALFWFIYRLWRLPILWLSRMRIYYSDRYAVELTGNPNAYGGALLKIALGIKEATIELGYLHPLLESFDLTLPLSPAQALAINPSLSSVPAGDCNHISRFTRSLMFSHPPLGERLYILGKCAEFWRVSPGFSLPERSSFNLWGAYLDLPLLPQAIVTAVIGGTILRCLFWLVGFISLRNGFQPLMWMANYPILRYWLGWIIIGVILSVVWVVRGRFPSVFIWVVFLKLIWDNLNRYNLGFLFWLFIDDPLLFPWILTVLSFAIIVGLNRYFPRVGGEQSPLNELLAESANRKTTSIVLEGKLLGRRGISNWLAQDLRLHTDRGSIELKYSTACGPLGNLFSFFPKPCEFTGKKVIVRGWLRHSIYPWMDVDTITVEGGRSLKSNYRVFLLILAFGSVIWSAYKIYKL